MHFLLNRFEKLCAAALLAAGLAAAGPAFAGNGTFTAPEPEDLIFYHVFLDRFANGDPTNDNANPRGNFNPNSGFGWHGGDFEGVRQKLPYIKGIGANAIWLSPFVENVRDYHGYAAFDFYKTDPNFGTLEELQTLIEEANELGIAVYFDMVAGHQGNLITSFEGGWPGYRPPPQEYNLSWTSGLRYPPPFDSLDYFHAHGHIGTFVRPEEELGELLGLDDLKTETPYVQQEMTKIWQYWVENTGVSGFRVDTVKHIDLGFWRAFLPPLRATAAAEGRDNFFMFGEIYGANDNFMREYIGTLEDPTYKFDSAVDFQFFYSSEGVFARADQPPSNIANRLLAREAALPGHHLQMPNFIDNHDLPRFLNIAQSNPGSGLAERHRRLELGLMMMLMSPGPPIVYYGTEQDFDGGTDPQNREDMFDGEYESGPSEGDNFDPTAPRYQLIARLSQLRAALAPLRRGSFDVHSAESSGPGHLAFSRTHEGETVLVTLNTSTSATLQPQITVPNLAGEMLVDALNPNNTITFDGAGVLSQRLLSGQAASIWVKQDQLPPLPVTVTATEPADGELNVPANLDEVTVTFSAPMDTAASAGAFSITPSVPFSLAWGAANETATLTFSEELQSRTVYTVEVNTTATSAEGAALAAPAASTWTTERIERPLPPLPSFYPPVAQLGTSINVNGDLSDWAMPATQSPNEGEVVDGDRFIWTDEEGDDRGPGTYTYPTNNNFSDDDVDIAVFGTAWDATNLYLVFQSHGRNPSASFFTAYFGAAIDTGPGGRRSLGFDQANGNNGVADILMRQEVEADYEVVFTGPRGATLVGPNGNAVSGVSLQSDYSQVTGVVEIAVPLAELGIDPATVPAEITILAYSGFEVFGSMREVGVTRGAYEPGGGIVSATDPNVFDLVGASRGDQETDLNDFDEVFRTTVGSSYLRLVLGEPATDGAADMWMLR